MQRKSTLPLFLAALCGTTAVGLQAAEAPVPTRKVSLTDCVQQALEHNLAIRISRFSPEIAGYNLTTARSSYDPEIFASAVRYGNTAVPRFSSEIGVLVPGSQTDTDDLRAGLQGSTPFGLGYTLQGNVSKTTGEQFITAGGAVLALPIEQSDASLSISLTQPLLKNFWINAPQLNIELAQSQLNVSEEALRQQVINSVTAVELAYYDLILAFESVKTQEKALEWAERQVADFQKKVEVGSMAPLDAQQAEATAASYHANVLVARQSLAVAQNTLKNLLTSDYSEWHGVNLQPTQVLSATPHAFSVSDSWLQGLTQRPDLVQLQLDLKQRGISTTFRKNQLLPQLDLVGSYRAIGTGVNEEDAIRGVRDRQGSSLSIGVQVTMPLGNRSARSSYRIAKAEQESALLRLKQLEQNVMVEIDNAVSRAKTDLERVAATRKAREYWTAALDAEQKKLENGKSTSFEVLRVQRDLVSAELQEMQALGDYNRSLIQLSASEASTLRRLNINFLNTTTPAR